MTISQARATSHLLTVADLDAEQFAALLDLAGQMKRYPLAWRGVLDGRSVACCFAKPSTRTRVSFEAAIFRLGGLPIMLCPDELRTRRRRADLRHRPRAVELLRRHRRAHVRAA